MQILPIPQPICKLRLAIRIAVNQRDIMISEASIFSNPVRRHCNRRVADGHPFYWLYYCRSRGASKDLRKTAPIEFLLIRSTSYQPLDISTLLSFIFITVSISVSVLRNVCFKTGSQCLPEKGFLGFCQRCKLRKIR